MRHIHDRVGASDRAMASLLNVVGEEQCQDQELRFKRKFDGAMRAPSITCHGPHKECLKWGWERYF
jgi:hypothetical protein